MQVIAGIVAALILTSAPVHAQKEQQEAPKKEPVFTISEVEAAQADLALLVVDASQPLTPADQAIAALVGSRPAIVALNKIDVLWSELQETRETDAAVVSQRVGTARALGVDEDAVFPISAQKALIAKKRAEFEESQKQQDAFSESDYPEGAQLCAKCNTTAVVMMDGCMTCLNCGDSKCG